MKMTIHSVASIEIDDPKELPLSSVSHRPYYARTITIKSMHNGVEQSDEINLFSDDEDALYIGEMV